MEQSERRDEIKRLLFLRRHETIDNLAKELNVSPRTIRRDIETLCLTEAIYTIPGRYTGGVYVSDGFDPYYKKFNDDEIKVITKLICYLECEKIKGFSAKEIVVLKILLQTYSNNKQRIKPSGSG